MGQATGDTEGGSGHHLDGDGGDVEVELHDGPLVGRREGPLRGRLLQVAGAGPSVVYVSGHQTPSLTMSYFLMTFSNQSFKPLEPKKIKKWVWQEFLDARV